MVANGVGTEEAEALDPLVVAEGVGTEEAVSVDPLVVAVVVADGVGTEEIHASHPFGRLFLIPGKSRIARFGPTGLLPSR